MVELNAIKQLTNNAFKSNEIHGMEYRKSFRVTLDYAVEVLSDVKVEYDA